MKHHYCTLFDSRYLTRGLAMYESLAATGADFHLYIFAFDDTAYGILRSLRLNNVTVVSLSEFEDEELLSVKPGRTAAEYCWTSTPSVILYCLEKFGLSGCTYLDADLYFYSDPSVLIEEMQDNSVLLTEHRYTPEYDQTVTSGRYCVQFITFRNDARGLAALKWWRNACIDWCYARAEDGKFGDQKYLDDWTERFEGVHVLRHPGGGVAPWNIQQYDIFHPDFPLVFYHFHDVRFYTDGRVSLGSYRLRRKEVQLLYKPYIQKLEEIRRRPEFRESASQISHFLPGKKSWRYYLRHIRNVVKGPWKINIYSLEELMK